MKSEDYRPDPLEQPDMRPQRYSARSPAERAAMFRERFPKSAMFQRLAAMIEAKR